jgi:hypothetical protein
MKLLIKTVCKLLIVLTPFILISIIELIVDPYNLFNISHVFSNETKKKCINSSASTWTRGNMLWKISEFRRAPTPNIVLGDSRMIDVTIQSLEKNMGGKVTNLSIPAGNYKTLIDLFWMAANSVKLENVIIQTNFTTYNSLTVYDLYGPAQEVIKKPYLFFFNSLYLKDTFNVLYYSLARNDKNVNQRSRQSFNSWEDSQKFINESYTSRRIYPKQLYIEFMKISAFCSREKINLIFVIAPDYYEVHSFTKKFNLEKEYINFKTDIEALGITIDLDNGQPFSFNKNNYYDHLHIKSNLADTLVAMIFHSEILNGYFKQLD